MERRCNPSVHLIQDIFFSVNDVQAL
uniref:Uncharacterized protein n=1 Tax=Anguilla anguilla TaxID=7936 RepID=A0A0E9UMS9_ANGAN